MIQLHSSAISSASPAAYTGRPNSLAFRVNSSTGSKPTATSAVSQNLIVLARKEVVRAQKVITATHKWATIIVFTVSFAGLIAAGFIFRILNTSITRRVLQLTSKAEEIRKGNLDVTANEGAMDEIGRLGHTFNFMAVKIKELIEKGYTINEYDKDVGRVRPIASYLLISEPLGVRS